MFTNDPLNKPTSRADVSHKPIKTDPRTTTTNPSPPSPSPSRSHQSPFNIPSISIASPSPKVNFIDPKTSPTKARPNGADLVSPPSHKTHTTGYANYNNKYRDIDQVKTDNSDDDVVRGATQVITSDPEVQRQKILNFLISDVQPQSFKPRPNNAADGVNVDDGNTAVFVISKPTTLASAPASSTSNRYEVVESEEEEDAVLPQRVQNQTKSLREPAAIEIVTLRQHEKSTATSSTQKMIEPTTYAPDTAWKMQYVVKKTTTFAPIIGKTTRDHGDDRNRNYHSDSPLQRLEHEQDNEESDSLYSYREHQPFNGVALTPTESQINSKYSYAFDPRQNSHYGQDKGTLVKQYALPPSSFGTSSKATLSKADPTTTPKLFVSPYTSLRTMLNEESVRSTSLRPIIRPIQTNRNAYAYDKWQPSVPFSGAPSPSPIPNLFNNFVLSTPKAGYVPRYNSIPDSTTSPSYSTSTQAVNRVKSVDRPFQPSGYGGSVYAKGSISVSNVHLTEMDLTTRDPLVHLTSPPAKNTTATPTSSSTSTTQQYYTPTTSRPEIRRKMMRPRTKKKITRPTKLTPITTVDEERVRETIGDNEFAKILEAVLETSQSDLQKLPVDDEIDDENRQGEEYYKIPSGDEEELHVVTITEKPTRYYSNYKQLTLEKTLGNAFYGYETTTGSTLAPEKITPYTKEPINPTHRPATNDSARPKFRATVEMPEFNVPTESEIKQFLYNLDRAAPTEDSLELTTTMTTPTSTYSYISTEPNAIYDEQITTTTDASSSEYSLITNAVPTTTTQTSTSTRTLSYPSSSTQLSINTLPPRASRVNPAIKTTIAATIPRRSNKANAAPPSSATPLKCSENTSNTKCNEIPLRYTSKPKPPKPSFSKQNQFSRQKSKNLEIKKKKKITKWIMKITK